MAATARAIPLNDKDLAGDGGGAYASIEVPGDYEVVLADVQDYDKRAAGRSYGWLFIYDCETPTGGSVQFNVFLSLKENARWKLVETLSAHGCDLTAGINEIDPNALVGEVVGAHIDFPRDKEGNVTSKYREIKTLFKIVAEPQVEATPRLEEVFAEAQAREAYDPTRDGAPFGEEDLPVI